MPFKTRRVRCPDGRSIRVYRRAEDAFPVVAASVRGAIGTTIEAADQLQLQLHGEAAREVREVATRLDHINQSLRERLRAVYIVYQADPCTNSRYLAEEVRRINQQEERLRELAVGLENLLRLHAHGTPAEEMLVLVRELTRRLGPPSAPASTAGQIEANARRWERGSG
jgi:hypothetical protein